MEGGFKQTMKSFGLLKIDLIQPDPGPLREIEGGIINDLRLSIEKYGVLQPILVRPYNGKYRIVFGNHRYYAAKGAGLKEIPAFIRDINSHEAILLSLSENIQRLEMNPMREGEIYQKLLSELFHTSRDLADAVGKSVTYINGRIKLYRNLHPDLKKEIGKTLTLTNALHLSNHNRKVQWELFQEIIKNREELKIRQKQIPYFGGQGRIPTGVPPYCICPKCGAKHLKNIDVVTRNELRK